MNPSEDHSHCCHTGGKDAPHAAHGKSPWAEAAHATLHCLTGCVIGEVTGLMIGVSIGLAAYPAMALSTLLAYISGFSLTVFPLMKRTGLNFPRAFKAVWVGEVISIGVMELVMNSVDYHMGGIRAGSITNGQFWLALLMAVPAGYVAALPVNAWLIGRELKRCH